MKNFRRLGKIALLGTCLLTFNNSCSNLEEEVFSDIDANSFGKTEEEAKAAFGSIYTQLYNFCNHNTIWSVQEVSSDELVIPQRGGDWYDGGQWLRMHRHEYTATEESFNNAFRFCYQGISLCNSLLRNPNLGADLKPEIRAVRALYYFWLLDMFGNVPIPTEASAAFTEGTKSRAEVYAFVEKELNEVIPSLKKDVTGTGYARMNFYAAKALQAKLYLNAQVYTGTAKWAEAKAACDAIIADGKYQLETSFKDAFKTENKASKENVFVIPYDEVNAQGFNLPQMTLHYESQKTYNLVSQPWNGYCSVQEFYNSFDANDTRRAANFVAGPQFAADGVTRLQDASAEPTDPDGQALTFTPALNELFPNCLRQAGVRVGKFEYKSGATQNLSNDFPIFRYADVILMKAEAMLRLNDAAGALVEVNRIRARAGVTAFTSVTLDNLLAERGREMFAEAWRRQDLIRFGKYSATRQYKPTTTANHKLVFPIPQPQLNSNSNLRQNTGY